MNPTLSCLSVAGGLSLLVLSGCGSTAASQDQAVSHPRVVLSTAVRKDVPIELQAIGNAEPYLSVSILPQVTGYLRRIDFREGADVRQGEPLFQLDARTFQEQVDQAEAALARDQAALQQATAAAERDRATAQNARAEQERYAKLYQQGIVSHEQMDQYKAAGDAAQQSVRADQASIQAARDSTRADQAQLAAQKVQLGYTTIRAPISGRTGSLNVRVGDLVRATDTTPLVVINQISPIYVSFSVPEDQLPEIQKHNAIHPLQVTAAPPQAGAASEAGQLFFIDNTVDASTGTIKLKALFPNTARRLWPGEFLNVTLRVSMEQGATVVPSAAVETGQNGKYVFVVGSDCIARMQSVSTGAALGDLVVITKGVSPGAQVVTDGQVNVVPGETVDVVSRLEDGAAPAKAP